MAAMSFAPTSQDPTAAFRLDGKVAILTGASSGLGSRFAAVLTGAGATVAVAARRAERLKELQVELVERRQAAGTPVADPDDLVLPVACDVTEAGAMEDLVAATIDRFGQVDIVVNNAGISRVLAAIDDDRDEFERELAINLVAPYELARHAARWMLEADRPGSIINVGSVLGHGGGGRLKVPGYTAAKGGLHNLTRELASQWARRGVRVNAIAPGWFDSEMTTDMFETDSGMNYITDNTPMGRPGRDGELDGALLYLASDASTYVTGQVLTVDGGWTAI